MSEPDGSTVFTDFFKVSEGIISVRPHLRQHSLKSAPVDTIFQRLPPQGWFFFVTTVSFSFSSLSFNISYPNQVADQSAVYVDKREFFHVVPVFERNEFLCLEVGMVKREFLPFSARDFHGRGIVFIGRFTCFYTKFYGESTVGRSTAVELQNTLFAAFEKRISQHIGRQVARGCGNARDIVCARFETRCDIFSRSVVDDPYVYAHFSFVDNVRTLGSNTVDFAVLEVVCLGEGRIVLTVFIEDRAVRKNSFVVRPHGYFAYGRGGGKDNSVPVSQLAVDLVVAIEKHEHFHVGSLVELSFRHECAVVLFESYRGGLGHRRRRIDIVEPYGHSLARSFGYYIAEIGAEAGVVGFVVAGEGKGVFHSVHTGNGAVGTRSVKYGTSYRLGVGLRRASAYEFYLVLAEVVFFGTCGIFEYTFAVLPARVVGNEYCVYAFVGTCDLPKDIATLGGGKEINFFILSHSVFDKGYDVSQKSAPYEYTGIFGRLFERAQMSLTIIEIGIRNSRGINGMTAFVRVAFVVKTNHAVTVGGKDVENFLFHITVETVDINQSSVFALARDFAVTIYERIFTVFVGRRYESFEHGVVVLAFVLNKFRLEFGVLFVICPQLRGRHKIVVHISIIIKI